MVKSRHTDLHRDRGRTWSRTTMPLDTANTTHTDGRLPPDLPPMGTGSVPAIPPVNNQLLSSTALRWFALVVSLLGGGGIAGYSLTSDEDTQQLEARIEALETRAENNEKSLATSLQANQEAMRSLQDVSMLALELSVDGHRYLTDTMVDATRLDHPDFVPRPRSERLERRLDRGARILDDEMYAR